MLILESEFHLVRCFAEKVDKHSNAHTCVSTCMNQEKVWPGVVNTDPISHALSLLFFFFSKEIFNSD